MDFDAKQRPPSTWVRCAEVALLAIALLVELTTVIEVQ